VRWTAETHFAELKTTLKMQKVKSMTANGVRKELAVYCLVYNQVHAIMLQAAAWQGVTPDRISFIDTVRWLLCAQAGEDLADLVINPARPDRHAPFQLRIASCLTVLRRERVSTPTRLRIPANDAGSGTAA
jgi:hypothetical protein